MTPIEEHIAINKTARYFLSGELNPNVKEVWIVLHGYGFLAEKFISWFEPVSNAERIFVAPEALSKFYLKGVGGKVGASWMTREDRLSEIEDYINYLNALVEKLGAFNNDKIQLNVLGFSQGTATACRWVSESDLKIENLVIWAGAVPDDMDLNIKKTRFDKFNTWLVYGDDDEFVNLNLFQKHVNDLKSKGINIKSFPFKGTHEIKEDTLLDFFKTLADK